MGKVSVRNHDLPVPHPDPEGRRDPNHALPRRRYDENYRRRRKNRGRRCRRVLLKFSPCQVVVSFMALEKLARTPKNRPRSTQDRKSQSIPPHSPDLSEFVHPSRCRFYYIVRPQKNDMFFRGRLFSVAFLLDSLSPLCYDHQKQGRYSTKGEHMNPEQLLIAVEEAIKLREDEGQKYWIICWHNKKIQCLGSKCTAKPEIIFLTVSGRDCEDGLNIKQWDLLKVRMKRFFERKPS